ncbi:type II toxin-antitoxin system HicB family antitoxin [Rhizobium sp. CC-YZS058]|uniref:type II toxin-antitoxin system HicB family antitoxin n=1 Tax=Rhizobium sp. CC-YZS058 TaxID=3042153 RepID=UPI002B05A224|nr:type II toxin-antitoxin system HicB family antitoxin [Rhizobium sp. CC-YZS058]MEA3535029.1 type II toxin-antitoxin system HicB family antitoxin [Rhizobium sp. CC-YZS058]
MRTVSHKGYQASVEFEDGALFIKVLHIDDLLIAECDRASDAARVAGELIDAYLDDCRQAGRAPSKPFKGSFNVRMPPGLHERAARRASDEGRSLNAWVCQAVEDKLDGKTAVSLTPSDQPRSDHAA